MNLINKKITLKWKSKDYVTKAISKLYDDRIKLFYSEILPDELPNNLPIHLFDYFCKCFLPIVKFAFPVEYSSTGESKRIIVHDGDKLRSNYKYLLKLDVFDYNKINNIEDLINISKNYDIVFLDCENPILNIYGIEYNKQIKEKFYYLNNINLSPLRYKTNIHRKYLVELSNNSVRENCSILLRINNIKEYKSKKTLLSYEYEFNNIYKKHELILPWFTKSIQNNYRVKICNFNYIDYSNIYFREINFEFEEYVKELKFSAIIKKYSFIFEAEKFINHNYRELFLIQSLQINSHTIEDYKLFISVVNKLNLKVNIKNYLLEIILRSLIQSEPSFSYEDKIAIASNWEESIPSNSYAHFMRVLENNSLKEVDDIINDDSKDYPSNFVNEYIRILNLFYNEDELKNVSNISMSEKILYNYLLGLIQREGLSIFNVLYSESFFIKHGNSLRNKLENRLSSIDISMFYNYDIGLILLLFGNREINVNDFIKLSMLPDAIPNLKFSNRTYIIEEIIHKLDIKVILNIHLRILTILKFYQLDEQHDNLLKKLYDTGKFNKSDLYWKKIYSESTLIKGYKFTDFLLNDPYLSSLCHFSKFISNYNQNLICHQ